MKTRYIIAFAAATLMLAGCQMDSLKENYGNIGRPILYSVSEDVCGDSNLTVRSYVAVPESSAEELFILRSDGNGSVITMRLDCESAEGFSGLKRSYASTKGALVNTSDGEKAMEGYADIVGSVVVSAFKGADEVITDETVSWNATKGKWLAENEHFWNPGDNLCFFSWGNLPTSDYVNVNCTKDALSLSYTQPSDPSAQTDIVLGTYSGDGGTTGTAELKFIHPLTAVIFKEGDLAGKKVKSIRLSGLASDGKVSVTTDGTIGDWQNISGYNAVSLQSSDGDDGLSVGATTNVIGEPFIIIPQPTASHNVKITVELTDGTCLVNTQSSAKWMAQKSSIYILNWQGVLVESITLNKTETTLDPGETDNLSVSEYLPDNATRKSVTWASSDPSVATVDASTGSVTAIAGGTATITATAIDAGKKTAACTVNVNTKVSGITFDKSSMTLDNRTKATGTIIATVTPAEATLQTLTWTSSDNGVATVSNGVVTPVANGTATITAKTTDGTNKSADCTVTVKTSLTGVTVSPNTTKTIYTNATPNSFAITPTNNPTTASIASLSWTSDNSGVATVSNGTVSAVANGNCTITYSATDAFGNTKTATCPVSVRTKVTGVSLSSSSASINKGATKTLTATISPANASNTGITWSTNNSGVATVANGVVTGVAAGTATITATTSDGGYTATCAVTVVIPVPDGYVDLGCPTCYFAKSDLSGTYHWASTVAGGSTPYTYEDEDESGYTKYDNNKKTLEPDDDAATKAGKGRMPDASELNYLVNSCTWTYNSSTKIWTVTGGNGNSITFTHSGPNYAKWWSRTIGDGSSSFAQCMDIAVGDNPAKGSLTSHYRSDLAYIRPVKDK